MAEYYVDYDTGDDGNSGTSVTECWQTLSHAISQAAAGDVIYVRRTHSESISTTPSASSGSNASPIIVARYCNEQSDVDWNNDEWTRPSITLQAVLLTDVSHWVFYGIEFIGDSSEVVTRYVDHVTYYDCVFDIQSYICESTNYLTLMDCDVTINQQAPFLNWFSNWVCINCKLRPSNNDVETLESDGGGNWVGRNILIGCDLAGEDTGYHYNSLMGYGVSWGRDVRIKCTKLASGISLGRFMHNTYWPPDNDAPHSPANSYVVEMTQSQVGVDFSGHGRSNLWISSFRSGFDGYDCLYVKPAYSGIATVLHQPREGRTLWLNPQMVEEVVYPHTGGVLGAFGIRFYPSGWDSRLNITGGNANFWMDVFWADPDGQVHCARTYNYVDSLNEGEWNNLYVTGIEPASGTNVYGFVQLAAYAEQGTIYIRPDLYFG